LKYLTQNESANSYGVELLTTHRLRCAWVLYYRTPQELKSWRRAAWGELVVAFLVVLAQVWLSYLFWNSVPELFLFREQIQIVLRFLEDAKNNN